MAYRNSNINIKLIKVFKNIIVALFLIITASLTACSSAEEVIDIREITAAYQITNNKSSSDDKRYMSFLEGMELAELYEYAASYEPNQTKLDIEFLPSHTDSITQGELFQIQVTNVITPQDIYIEQDLTPNFKWYQSLDEQTGLYQLTGYIATNFNTKTGLSTIKYGSKLFNEEYILQLQIVPYDYLVQRLYIDQQIVDSTSNDQAYIQFAKYFHPARDLSAEYKYYDKSFIWPTRGRLTTEFGQQRFVNDAASSSPHSGIDIAAAQGTAIYATNSGRITLAMNLILTGNTIVIDHGQGLFSVYYHMHENLVEQGQVVERGQLIAKVGTTGFSTGPHLHFTISYYRANLEPGYFLAGEPIRLTNYEQLMH